MFLLPYEHFTIHTSLRAEDVVRRLEEVIEPDRFFRGWGSNHKPYQGKVEHDHFLVNRIIHYRNSFLPRIQGKITRERSGCSVEITMHLHIVTMIFMTVWLGGVSVSFFSTIWAILNTPHYLPLEGLLIPAAMFLFGYALTVGGFQFEAAKSISFFRNLIGK